MWKYRMFFWRLLLVVMTVFGMQKLSLEVCAAAFGENEFQNISGEIEVIFNRSEADMEPYIEAFERKYPDVTVKYTNYADIEAGLAKRMEEGDYGDVCYIPHFLSQSNISDYFAPLGNSTIMRHTYNYLDLGKFMNNFVYGLPSSVYLNGIIYNKEVFDKAGITNLPTSMDEFLYVMYLINEHTDALPFYTGAKSERWMLQNWDAFRFIEMTGNPSYKYGKFVTEKEPFHEGTVHYKALHLLYDLVAYGYTEVGKETIDWDESITMLHRGEIASTAMGTWALSNYKNAGKNGENIGFMPFPNTVDGVQYATLNADYCYGVARNSDNREAAKAFLFFMVDESGYAFDHDTISILKADPYPECYDGMTQTTMQVSMATQIEYYNQYLKLSSKLNFEDGIEYGRIVQAAARESHETFDEIMADWNQRWESSRDEKMVTEIEDNEETYESAILTVDNQTIEVSENERQYISENPILRIGYHRKNAPLSFEMDGMFTGVAYDVCEMVADATGIVMEYCGYDDIISLETALENGDINIIAGLERHEDERGLRYSKDYLNYMDVIVRHNTVAANAQKTVAVISGEHEKEQDVTSKIVFADSIGDAVQMVQNMSADYMITNYYSANYYVRERNCADVTIVPYTTSETYHMVFGPEASPTLIAICNKCIYSLQEGQMQIALLGYMDSVVKNVTLETFISANPLLSVAVVSAVFLVVIGAVILITFVKAKANRERALQAQKYEQLAALADETFFEYNIIKKTLNFDEKFRATYGFPKEVSESNAGDKRNFVKQFLRQIDKSLLKKENVQFSIFLDTENGEKQWYRAVTSIIYDKKQPVHLLGKLVNIQKEMEAVETYQNKAHTDALTKIYNREGFRINIPAEAENVTLAVLDIDEFKMINDTLGHDGGDYALTYFAKTLQEVLGKDGIVGRYGGDEFVAMLVNVPEPEARKRLARLVNNMNTELRYGDSFKKVSISVGAVFAEKMEPFEKMFSRADEVLYATKNSGKNNYHLEMYTAKRDS